MAKVRLGLSDLTILEKVQLARNVVTSLTGNATFVGPTPTLGTLVAAAADLEAKANDAQLKRQASQMATNLQNDSETALDRLLVQIGSYVDLVSAGDTAKIQSAGLSIRSEPAAVGTLPAPQDLSATGGDDAGEVHLQWRPVPKTRSYVIECSPDPITPTSWKAAGISTKSKTTVTGLTTGTKSWFRVAAVNTAGQGPWSGPATSLAS